LVAVVVDGLVLDVGAVVVEVITWCWSWSEPSCSMTPEQSSWSNPRW
jgi:hypothetical protein